MQRSPKRSNRPACNLLDGAEKRSPGGPCNGSSLPCVKLSRALEEDVASSLCARHLVASKLRTIVLTGRCVALDLAVAVLKHDGQELRSSSFEASALTTSKYPSTHVAHQTSQRFPFGSSKCGEAPVLVTWQSLMGHHSSWVC